MKLYVNSISTGGIERSTGFLFHACDLRAVKNITFYSEEDEEAIELLKSKNVSFDLIDLSNCSLVFKIKAKLKGINSTPTLILEGGAKLKGIKQIKAYFEKQTHSR